MNYGTDRITITKAQDGTAAHYYAVHVDGELRDAYGYEDRQGERWAWGQANRRASRELYRLRHVTPPIRTTCPVYVKRYSTGYCVYAFGWDRSDAVKHVCKVLRSAGHRTLSLHDVADLRRQGEKEHISEHTVDLSSAVMHKVNIWPKKDTCHD